MEPGRPLAGREVGFKLSGLKPWEAVKVTFVTPQGEKAVWVSDGESYVVDRDGVRTTIGTVYADADGVGMWRRLGVNDPEGIWSVQLEFEDSFSTVVTYPVSQVQTPLSSLKTLGIEFRCYQGAVSSTCFSRRVPTAWALDSQAHLVEVASQLEARYGIQSRRIPDIYFVADRGAFEEVAHAIGATLEWAAGFYTASPSYRGIYMRVDFMPGAMRRVLTHEYTHLAMDELVQGKAVPAWLNEGFAEYSGADLALYDRYQDSVFKHLMFDFDAAVKAVREGRWISLSQLESQGTWNGEQDETRVALQYAQAHMVVRYIGETYGDAKLIGLFEALAAGATLPEGIRSTMGREYGQFEQDARAWLTTWDSPERILAAKYFALVDSALKVDESVSERRAADVNSGSALYQKASQRRQFIAELQTAQQQMQAGSPTPRLQTLHDALLSYLSARIAWLSVEREWAETGNDAKRVQANDMFPQINRHSRAVYSAVNSGRYIYWSATQ